MRTAWKPILFVVVSFILEEVIASFIFTTEITHRNNYADLTIAQAIYYCLWPIATFVLLHKMFKLKKWTPGHSIFAVCIFTGGIGIALLKKYGPHLSQLAPAMFAVIWITFAFVISFKAHERYILQTTQNRISKSYQSKEQFIFRNMIDGFVLYIPLVLSVLAQLLALYLLPIQGLSIVFRFQMFTYTLVILLLMIFLFMFYFRASFIFNKIEFDGDGIILKQNQKRNKPPIFNLSYNQIDEVSVRDIRINYVLKRTCKAYVFRHHKRREHYLRYDIKDNEQFEDDLVKAGVKVTA